MKLTRNKDKYGLTIWRYEGKSHNWKMYKDDVEGECKWVVQQFTHEGIKIDDNDDEVFDLMLELQPRLSDIKWEIYWWEDEYITNKQTEV